MPRDYYKPSLKRVSGKKNYYVIITKPVELQTPNNKQHRVSTGTDNLRLAQMKVGQIAEQIYREWDQVLRKDPYLELVQSLWDESRLGDFNEAKLMAEQQNEITLLGEILVSNVDIGKGALNDLLELLEPVDAGSLMIMYNKRYHGLAVPHQMGGEESPYPAHHQQKQIDNDLAETAIKAKQAKPAVNRTGAPKLADVKALYERDRVHWNDKREDTKARSLARIDDCIELIGNIPIDQLRAHDSIKIATALHENNVANKTIKNWISPLRAMVGWAATSGKLLNTLVNPPMPWIDINPLIGVKLGQYGLPGRNWEALKVDQLHKLFQLDLPDQDRLILSMLITTGMRLDEAALLDWSQLKHDRSGIRYFDLSLGAIVKNDKFSARTVAIPDCLVLPEVGAGRIFDYKIGRDGKASLDASRKLNKHVHQIRYDEADDRKVVHSLRHNVAGFMRSLRPTPSSEVMDWITGHGMEGQIKASVRQRTYNEDVDVGLKYEVVNRIDHPWLR